MLPVGQWDVLIKNARADKVLDGDDEFFLEKWSRFDNRIGPRSDAKRSMQRFFMLRGEKFCVEVLEAVLHDFLLAYL